jgi:putative transposase
MSTKSSGRGCVYSLQYHIVWCVKYRHKIITKEIHEYLYIILNAIALSSGFTIEEYNTEADHVHILIRCNPQHYIPDIIQKLKGISSKMLMEKFGKEIKSKLWGGSIWNPSYFIATVSENTEQQIRNYIHNQNSQKYT